MAWQCDQHLLNIAMRQWNLCRQQRLSARSTRVLNYILQVSATKAQPGLVTVMSSPLELVIYCSNSYFRMAFSSTVNECV
mmetsp:Transcript_7009/g.11152  ORF Transcript_7009/g.11152 Transcript_7009/m.11152 type:complete len:80 (+) Transcript_7009:242-481(+)